MPIWFYVFGAVIFGSIIAVNIWLYSLSAEERELLDAEIQDDMHNFSM